MISVGLEFSYEALLAFEAPTGQLRTSLRYVSTDVRASLPAGRGGGGGGRRARGRGVLPRRLQQARAQAPARHVPRA